MGSGFDVTFRELDGPLRDAQLISIEKGTFEGEQWMPSRRLNGDERHVSLPERSTVLRVRVARSHLAQTSTRFIAELPL
jgi:Domain of unknown function (DUF5597)